MPLPRVVPAMLPGMSCVISLNGLCEISLYFSVLSCTYSIFAAFLISNFLFSLHFLVRCSLRCMTAPRPSSAQTIRSAVFILFCRTSSNSLWIPRGTAFCISPTLVLAAYHCTTTDGAIEYEQVCIGEYAVNNGKRGSLHGGISLRRTAHFSKDDGDWCFLERSDGREFKNTLELCDALNLPTTDGATVRACFVPCDINPSTALKTTLGEYEKIKQYAPAVNDDQEENEGYEDSDSAIDSPRNDPMNIFLCVVGGLFGGCCGAPYLDEKDRVVAFHEYSCDDSEVARPLSEMVAACLKSSNKRQKRCCETSVDQSDTESSRGGFASIKQGIVLAKVGSLVRAVRSLLHVELNEKIGDEYDMPAVVEK